MNGILEHADQVYNYDNQALLDICKKQKKIQNVTQDDINN